MPIYSTPAFLVLSSVLLGRYPPRVSSASSAGSWLQKSRQNEGPGRECMS